ncbi:hypothetical protein [Luteimonas vadosa]|uniref:Uncharacterized protein n=1 Tax=Luteimonas vadosa TaxID=1165507 RepID=A0ABP9E0N0_9GAMM
MSPRTHTLPAPLKLLALLLALLACMQAAPAHAALFGKSPARTAEEAERAGMVAVTIWVDASWGFRKQGAANDLSAAHQAFTARGYRVASVEPYIENGDLEGFFVTYQKP